MAFPNPPAKRRPRGPDKKPRKKPRKYSEGALDALRHVVAPLLADPVIQARLNEPPDPFADVSPAIEPPEEPWVPPVLDPPEEPWVPPMAPPDPWNPPALLPAPPAEPGLSEHARTVTDGGLAIAQFYLQTMQGTITPSQRQMEAAKELASWIGHKPAPPVAPAAAGGGTTNFTQMILRVAGATDDDLAALDRRPSRVPREVMEAQYSALVVGGPEPPPPEPVEFEETWDDA